MLSLIRVLPHTTRQSRPIALWLRRALSVQRQRARLATLDDRMLRDIGLTRAEAEAEATRPAWDVPSNWKRQ
jgi:uncharacterized protein YjiS (DUF1127 family)